uniref:Uncharacterized protein n=1 Tax=Junco hyemalis TaxID=40217 RepID=A0A8C5J409_JUNHY
MTSKMLFCPIMSVLMPADKKLNGDQSIFRRKIPSETVVVFIYSLYDTFKLPSPGRKRLPKLLGNSNFLTCLGTPVN